MEGVITEDEHHETSLTVTARVLCTSLPGIRRLELSRFSSPHFTRCLREITQVCQVLNDLRLERAMFMFRDSKGIVLSLPGLRTLSVMLCDTITTDHDKETFVIGAQGSSSSPLFPRMKVLKVSEKRWNSW